MTDRGSALIETLVLGFVAVMLVLQASMAAARIQTAGEEATEVAQAAATWATRYGDRDGAEQLVHDRVITCGVPAPGASATETALNSWSTICCPKPLWRWRAGGIGYG